jgi:hypothetical protein
MNRPAPERFHRNVFYAITMENRRNGVFSIVLSGEQGLL